jgi:hypothetical protein
MSRSISEHDLEAYLDEALPPADAASVEQALRGDSELVRLFAAVRARRDSGMHSLGAIWRRHRLSCPGREQLGSYLLKALPSDVSEHVRFHLQVIGCRYCQANLEDLQSRQSESTTVAVTRRRRYFQSSAGYLRRDR